MTVLKNSRQAAASWGGKLAAVACGGSPRSALLAGVMVTAGQEGRLTHSFFAGYGFSGILIAFLARNNALAAIATAFLIALLYIAGQSLQVFYQIPFAMVQLIQAILVICVASSDFFIRHRVKRLNSGGAS